ncbi:OOP family OmpA-OmpF porin [Rhodobacter aestuarii]|uniref:OmpA-OmpF porin, OOP family n=1 Tax=Rhodobacter aestuarii TaxID=453582 RepID=A0A1N7KD08_9RHOB|nr:OmpA family protein [Rhodobacter aestuarii]PTV95753.1 OOP family OmpA-OmpF porin [Rhodobacter aestuarii]SIS59485.1 OmpA-OmpF porin, OOP family [Rhodobacter aestuarii]
MRARTTALTATAFVSALVLCAFIAGGSATIIEQRSRKAVRLVLEANGHSWAQVHTDGLQVILLGTAPSEAERFRTVTLVSTVVDSSRIVDNTDAVVAKAIAPPDFSLQLLRNDEGISLIGLVPKGTDREALMKRLTALAGEGNVTDMLESAEYPVPKGWSPAFEFGIATLEKLPRAKVSIDPGAVGVEAITDSAEEKAAVEAQLNRSRPSGVRLDAKISAPRPVITPFTLRFLIDDEGARFDACSADTVRSRATILTAARKAGAMGDLDCTVGMGAPSPQWGEAVGMALGALGELGAGTVTISDADISLVAADTVAQASYDKIVGELESNLPPVFSLKAELTKKAEAAGSVPEFTALLGEDGRVELRGRVSSERSREALESFARAQFGADAIYAATLVDADLPQGWPLRTMTALEALDMLNSGSVTVTPQLIRLSGLTGDKQATDKAARILSQRLGEDARIELSVKYDQRLDETLALPDGPECVAKLNAILTASKVTFEPASAKIPEDNAPQLDALARIMKQCQDFRMEVAGHTDSQGGEEGNLRLSQNRAEAVLDALRARRVLVGNLTAKGYGETRPIADNETEEGREANRRIEFVLLDAEPVNVPEPVILPLSEGALDAEEPTEDPPQEMLDESAIEDAAPMEDAHGEPMPEADEEGLAPEAETSIADDSAPVTEQAAEATEEAAPAEDAQVVEEVAPAESPEDTAPEDVVTEVEETTEAAEPATETAPAEAAPEETAEPEIEIPVRPAAESPGRPKPRPAGLGPAGN